MKYSESICSSILKSIRDSRICSDLGYISESIQKVLHGYGYLMEYLCFRVTNQYTRKIVVPLRVRDNINVNNNIGCNMCRSHPNKILTLIGQQRFMSHNKGMGSGVITIAGKHPLFSGSKPFPI